MAEALACTTCSAPAVAAPGGLVRCGACGLVFDAAARAYPAPPPARPASGPPAGLTLASGAARVEVSWWRAWGLRRWPAAVVTGLHLVLIAFGLWQGALGPVAFLALMVAIQVALYRRVLAQRTVLEADAAGLRVRHAPKGARPDVALDAPQVRQLFVLEVAPRTARGELLKPGRKRRRCFALCALVGDALEPRKLVDALLSVHAAFALEDVARVGLGLAAAPVKGAVERKVEGSSLPSPERQAR